jgi:hypothetical protein
MNAFESSLQFIERHHQNVLQTVPILLKSTLFIFFVWGAPNNHDGRNRMGVNALFEVIRQAVDLSLHMAALADDLGDRTAKLVGRGIGLSVGFSEQVMLGVLDLYQGEIPGGFRCHEKVRILAASTMEALSTYIGLICDFLYGIPKRHVEHKWIFAEESLPFGFTGIVIHHLPINLDELCGMH